MEKTTFAGLTVLAPDESVLEDGGAFIGHDRLTIDRLLRIGAKTHRHTGRSGINSPTVAPSASVVASGGLIGSDINLTIGYSLVDDAGGETLISPLATLATPAGLTAPTSAFAATVDYTAGSVPLGDFYYGLTYADAGGGETPLGPVALVEREPGFANARVLLSGLAGGLVGASAAAWKLYRAQNGGDFGLLASGTANTYTDDGSVGTQGEFIPPLDDSVLTNAVNTVLVTLPVSGGIANATTINLYLTETDEFTGGTLIATAPVASAGHTFTFTTLDPSDQDPSDVNLSIGDPHQIDPDTEMLDWHWKRPVTGSAGLGSGSAGDVRFDEAEPGLYGLTADSPVASAWVRLTPVRAQVVTSVLGSGASAIVDIPFAEAMASGYTVVGSVEASQTGGGFEFVRVYSRSETKAQVIVRNTGPSGAGRVHALLM